MDTLHWKAESSRYALERRERGRTGPLETQKLVVRSVDFSVSHCPSFTPQKSGNATEWESSSEGNHFLLSQNLLFASAWPLHFWDRHRKNSEETQRAKSRR